MTTARYLDSPRNALVGGVQVQSGATRQVIGVAAGPAKVRAIRAALRGHILNALVTDEATAKAILDLG